MKNKKHSNYEKPAQSTAHSAVDALIVNEEDQQDLRVLDEIASSKARSLRELQMEIGKLELEKSLLLEKSKMLQTEAQSAYNTLMDKLKSAAHKKGIDADDPSKGRWLFDLKTMSFTKAP